MEKIIVKVEKIVVYFWQDWSCYLEAVTVAFRQDTRNMHYVACFALKCEFGVPGENIAV
jgi:hypothetical protein